MFLVGEWGAERGVHDSGAHQRGQGGGRGALPLLPQTEKWAGRLALPTACRTQIPALPPASQVIFSNSSFLCVSVSSSVKWKTKIVATGSSLAAHGLGL